MLNYCSIYCILIQSHCIPLQYYLYKRSQITAANGLCYSVHLFVKEVQVAVGDNMTSLA